MLCTTLFSLDAQVFLNISLCLGKFCSVSTLNTTKVKFSIEFDLQSGKVNSQKDYLT